MVVDTVCVLTATIGTGSQELGPACPPAGSGLWLAMLSLLVLLCSVQAAWNRGLYLHNQASAHAGRGLANMLSREPGVIEGYIQLYEM